MNPIEEEVMEYFAGLDASLETINICIVDHDGNVLLERKVDAEPDAIVAVLESFGRPFKRIGLKQVRPPPGSIVGCVRRATRRSVSSAGTSRPG